MMPSESSLLCTFSEDQQKIIEKRTAQRGKAPGRLHAFGAHNPSYQNNFESYQNVRKRRVLHYAYGKSLRLAECLIKSNELNEWVLSDTLVYDSVYYGIPVWCPHRTRRRSQSVSRQQRNVYRKKNGCDTKFLDRRPQATNATSSTRSDHIELPEGSTYTRRSAASLQSMYICKS